MINKKSVIILSIISMAGLMAACGGNKSKLDIAAGIRSENARQVDTTSESDVWSEDSDGVEIPEMEGSNEVSINKKGKITNTIVQSFEEDYFDKDSLETFIKAEISDYNRAQGKDSVELKAVKVDDEAQIVIVFDSSSYFADFNTQTFFYGTIEEATLEDYNLNLDYVDVKTGEAVDIDTALNKEKRHVVITRSERDRLDIIVPKDIIYVSKNITLDKKTKREVQAPQGEMSVIITK